MIWIWKIACGILLAGIIKIVFTAILETIVDHFSDDEDTISCAGSVTVKIKDCTIEINDCSKEE